LPVRVRGKGFKLIIFGHGAESNTKIIEHLKNGFSRPDDATAKTDFPFAALRVSFVVPDH